MKYRLVCLLTLSLLILAGCALKPFVPLPGSSYNVEDRYAIVQNDSLMIIVRPQAYYGRSSSISSSFFPVFINVKNKSNKTAVLSRDSFSLIAGDQQYDYIPLQFVLGSIRHINLESQFQFEDVFEQAFPPEQDRYLAEAREQYLDLVNNYFSFGTILPRGEKQGYLFYDERVGRLSSFDLDVLGTKVSFSRE